MPSLRQSPRRRVTAAAIAIVIASPLSGGCLFDSEPENHAPVMQSLSADPSEVFPGDGATVRVGAADRDGDRLTYRWDATCGTIPADARADTVRWQAPETAGVCSVTVVVSDGDAWVRGAVPIRVLLPEPALSVSPDSLDFSSTVVGRSVAVENAGTGDLVWTIASPDFWIELDPTAGTTRSETDWVNVTVSRSGLAPGSHVGAFFVNSNGGADTVAVRVEVPTEPSLAVDPADLDFGESITDLAFTIRNTGTGTLTWGVTTDVDWAEVEPASGSATSEIDSVRVSVERERLDPGEHGGVATVLSDGGTAAVDLLLEVPETPVYSYEVLNVYPHDPTAYTQGLVYHEGFLYEGTGIRGASTLRKVELETGDTLQVHHLDDDLFGEGITIFGDRILQLTWKAGIGFVYDLASFEVIDDFTYATDEGWGLTHDGVRLIMSDGTSTLYFLDPDTFFWVGSVSVYDHATAVRYLNELEYIQGEVYANVYETNRIARIDPETGRVTAWIDLTGLLGPKGGAVPDVLNGIAYDAETDRLFVTGKRWPSLFEIDLVAP